MKKSAPHALPSCGWMHKQDRVYTEHPSGAMRRPDRYGLTARDQRRYGRPQEATRNRAPSSFFHPQEGARAEGRYTKRRCIPMHSHRRATQTRLLRLAHAVKCRRQMSPCRRQQLRRESQPPCALSTVFKGGQSAGNFFENLNRLNLVLIEYCPSQRAQCSQRGEKGLAGSTRPPPCVYGLF